MPPLVIREQPPLTNAAARQGGSAPALAGFSGSGIANLLEADAALPAFVDFPLVYLGFLGLLQQRPSLRGLFALANHRVMHIEGAPPPQRAFPLRRARRRSRPPPVPAGFSALPAGGRFLDGPRPVSSRPA